ncbi:translation elongation factor Ts [Phoenicibacter congonensis]|uniref:translation elongation factor Ts n=1 Tax=Phoenicibacter congonensis TaxID=1944646 RepID=UPI0009A7F410|nr:translation elongation factor Ts [Phoenicibacter congonensis]
MAEITAALVKELREITGAGMMECKKALTEAEGEIEAAIDVLRTRGLAAVAKKAGRATNEGTVMAVTSPSQKDGVIVELKCETDFVGMNEKFHAYAKKIADAALYSDNEVTAENIKDCELDGEKVSDILTDCIHVMGENSEIATVTKVHADGVASYIHGGGKIGVLVTFELSDEIDPAEAGFIACARDVAMQVAATDPVAATREDVPEEIREHEMGIYKAQAAESGKPEAIQTKIAEGRMHKFFAENCLVEQAFVKDGDLTVEQYVDKCAKELGGQMKVTGFVRVALAA